MKVKACVRSGFCCKQAPCGYGEWNKERTQCAFLMGDKPGGYYCGKYDEICKQPGWEFYPAFGAGCCSPLNTDRKAVIQQRGLGEVHVDIADYPSL